MVYVLDDLTAVDATSRANGLSDVYVGESLNAAARMRQHLASMEKRHLTSARFIVDDTFNKSVCLDLESYLIRMLAGDGTHRVLNRNDGIVDADYYDRDRYRQTFQEVFGELKDMGLFTRSIPAIENSDLFKLSPFKTLTHDQAAAVEDILEGLFDDFSTGAGSTVVLQGDPGTGKTVVAIYLLKLLRDIADTTPPDGLDSDSLFSDFFAEGFRELIVGKRFGLVVPQQSLRDSIKKVFRRTPGLHPDMVLTAFDVGSAGEDFDLLIVDEAHGLNQRASQSSGVQNKKFRLITERLFHFDDKTKTQLDWILAKSRHQIFLLDAHQSIRPADIPLAVVPREVVNAG
ncbi:DNA/RNA helicase domain-containing protein [Leifsonia sp. McL0607]|uniref:DNA/RNA helicase domain-containing protein n=1 Tax=Leifsonia sp. McL0607 TaxID=3415672 RepID=UPI003CF2DAB1